MSTQLNSSNDTLLKIQSTLNNFVHFWNEKDIDSFCTLFTEDIEFTDVVRQMAIGIDAVREQHIFPFKVVMKNAKLELTDEYARHIHTELILLSANWKVVGSMSPDGKPLPDRSGVIQIIFKQISNETWKIKLVHNSDFSLPYEQRNRVIQ